MSVFIAIIGVVAAGVILSCSANVSIKGYVDGQFENSYRKLGMESYANHYRGPFAWVYEIAFELGKRRDIDKVRAQERARSAARKARAMERLARKGER